jgi:predicted homoserine dehydrogenase-like protein
MELVDWARTSGFTVAAAGNGWENWEFSKELTDFGELNPYMHTSFRDGTKAAVANAARLVPSDNGLIFTPGNIEEIATITRPSSIGGVLDHDGNVDVMSSVTRAGEWIPFNT